VTAGSCLPLLWICGPPGVGKSTVSWQLYEELAVSGVRVAFADGDQLCMCYPAPAGDPDRQRVRALNVGAMIPNLRSAGAQCVIVNGVLGPAGLEAGLLPGTRVTICRLRASIDTVERRLIARQGHREVSGELLREVRDAARRMDESSFVHACVDTTGVPVGDAPAWFVPRAATGPASPAVFPRPGASSRPGQARPPRDESRSSTGRPA
jgi:gluconate kinase